MAKAKRPVTKTGKPRYFFACEPKGEAVDSVPEGYRIEESVNGVVSLVKERPRLIASNETATVQAALKGHPKPGNYLLAIKRNQIVVYERQGPDPEALSAIFADYGPLPQSAIEGLDQSAHYTPILRFVRHDSDRREFTAERWCFLGSVDDWISTGHSGQIEALARALIPLLGTDGFFDLY